jgi:hypothetical protein
MSAVGPAMPRGARSRRQEAWATSAEEKSRIHGLDAALMGVWVMAEPS